MWRVCSKHMDMKVFHHVKVYIVCVFSFRPIWDDNLLELTH